MSRQTCKSPPICLSYSISFKERVTRFNKYLGTQSTGPPPKQGPADSTGRPLLPPAGAWGQLTWFRVTAVGGARVAAAALGPRAAAVAAAAAAAAAAAVAQAGPAPQPGLWRRRGRGLRLLGCKTGSINPQSAIAGGHWETAIYLLLDVLFAVSYCSAGC